MAIWGALLETFFIFGLGLCLFRPRHSWLVGDFNHLEK
jgi:hypothetical protein